MDKLKPLFDAYTGPCQDKYHFWTGFLLLVRSILYLVFAFNTPGDPSLNLLVITLTLLSLTVRFGIFHPVFKKRYYNMLEFSTWVQVQLLHCILHAANGNQAAVIYTSTSIVFSTFVGTTLFHVYKRAMYHHRASAMLAESMYSCFLQSKQHKDI